MKTKLRANPPDRITNPKAGDPASATSWAITLPLDKRVADIERTWGSLDLFLAYAHDNHRERFARVLARVNDAIDGLDNDALKKATASALKGLERIGETIAERNLVPPPIRYLAQDGLLIAETSEDAKRLKHHFGSTGRIYALDELAMIVSWFEEKNTTIRAAKDMSGTIEAIRERTPTELELNDAIPY